MASKKLLALAAALILLAGTQCLWAAELQVGDPVPSFRLMGSDGNYYTPDQFKGKKAMIIAWFPKAFTGG